MTHTLTGILGRGGEGQYNVAPCEKRQGWQGGGKRGGEGREGNKRGRERGEILPLPPSPNT